MTNHNNSIHFERPSNIIPFPQLSPVRERLKSLGPCDLERELDYKNLGFFPSDVPELIKILEQDIQDDDFCLSEETSSVPVHAWRILGALQEPKAIPVLLERLMISLEDDDWALDELPPLLASFGEKSLNLLCERYIKGYEYRSELYNFLGLGDALVNIAEKKPSNKQSILPLFRDKLKNFQWNHPTFNAFLISQILQLKDFEAVDLIQQAFVQQFVDTSIIDWEWVHTFFKKEGIPLKKKLPVPTLAVPLQRIGCESIAFAGDEKFNHLLKQMGCFTHIDEVKMIILGSILATDFVSPGQVLKEILVDFEEEEIEFTTQGQLEHFMKEFTGLWNSLAQFQHQFFPFPAFLNNHGQWADFDDEKGQLGLSMLSYKTQIQLSRFLHGLNLGGTTPESFSSQANESLKAKEFLLFLEESLDELEKNFLQWLDQNHDPFQGEVVKTCLHAIEKEWNKNFLSLAQACLQQRLLMAPEGNVKFLKDHQSRKRKAEKEMK